MTHGNMFDYEVETIKNKMMEIAKEKGADGIIFLDMQNIREHDHFDDLGDEDRISITAKVIKSLFKIWLLRKKLSHFHLRRGTKIGVYLDN